MNNPRRGQQFSPTHVRDLHLPFETRSSSWAFFLSVQHYNPPRGTSHKPRRYPFPSHFTINKSYKLCSLNSSSLMDQLLCSPSLTILKSPASLYLSSSLIILPVLLPASPFFTLASKYHLVFLFALLMPEKVTQFLNLTASYMSYTLLTSQAHFLHSFLILQLKETATYSPPGSGQWMDAAPPGWSALLPKRLFPRTTTQN